MSTHKPSTAKAAAAYLIAATAGIGLLTFLPSSVTTTAHTVATEAAAPVAAPVAAPAPVPTTAPAPVVEPEPVTPVHAAPVAAPVPTTPAPVVEPEPVHTGSAPVPIGVTCEESVAASLAWYTGPITDDTVSVLHDGCAELGAAAQAVIFEDGSWVVYTPEGVALWRGCASELADCAD